MFEFGTLKRLGWYCECAHTRSTDAQAHLAERKCNDLANVSASFEFKKSNLYNGLGVIQN